MTEPASPRHGPFTAPEPDAARHDRRWSWFVRALVVVAVLAGAWLFATLRTPLRAHEGEARNSGEANEATSASASSPAR
jgi:hypothetical protein